MYAAYYRTTCDMYEIELQIWNTSGMEKLKASIYYRDTHPGINAYCLLKMQSPVYLQKWLYSFNACVKKQCYLIVTENEDDVKTGELSNEKIKQ